MIDKLQIKNFQSYKKSKLEFHSGVNIVIGTSDSGKSSLIRALIWAIYNRPQGQAFRSSWGGDTEVEIELDGDISILRRRTNSKNEYILNKDEDNPFQALRSEVPEEIQDILNINEINLQQQHDRPFLISSTSGEVAEHFNQVADLSKIGQTLRTVERWLREITRKKENQQVNLKQLQQDAMSYEYLDSTEIRIEVLEEIQDRINSKEKQRIEIQTLINRLDEVDLKIQQKSAILQAEQKVNNLINKQKQLDNLKYDQTGLKAWIVSYNSIDEEILECQSLISLEEKVGLIQSKIKQHSTKYDESIALLGIVKIIEKNTISIKNKKKELTDLQQEFDEEMPDICPLCGTKK